MDGTQKSREVQGTYPRATSARKEGDALPGNRLRDHWRSPSSGRGGGRRRQEAAESELRGSLHSDATRCSGEERCSGPVGRDSLEEGEGWQGRACSPLTPHGSCNATTSMVPSQSLLCVGRSIATPLRESNRGPGQPGPRIARARCSTDCAAQVRVRIDSSVAFMLISPCHFLDHETKWLRE
jgi:hypothetical protein